MTLDTMASINGYAAECVPLWRNWNFRTEAQKWNTLLTAIRARIGFLPNLNWIEGRFGPRIYAYFNGETWSVTLNHQVCSYDALPLAAFLEFVTTPYQEARHAEQAYKIAQGVLCGEIKIPGMGVGGSSGMQAMAGRSFQDIRRAFETGRPLEVSDSARRQTVQKWLKLNMTVITHADQHRAQFHNFSPELKNKVYAWAQTFHQGCTAQMDQEIQGGVSGGRNATESFKKVYRGLAEEKDAHAIQARVQQAILQGLNKTLPADADERPRQAPPARPARPPRPIGRAPARPARPPGRPGRRHP